MTSTISPYFTSLRDLQLVTPHQYEQALAHDDFQDLDAVESDAGALFWLLVRGIVKEDELEGRVEALSSASDDDAGAGGKLAIVQVTLGMAADVIRQMNRVPMEVLQALGLIDAVQCEAGCELRPQRVEGRIDSPARALAVLVNRGIVSELQFAAMKAEAAGTSLLADAKERQAIVAQAEQITHDMVGQYVKAMSGGVLRLFGLIMLVVFLLVGLAVWFKA